MQRISAVFLAGLITTACSTVPELPSEETVSATRVIDRLQCELAEAVRQAVADHKWLLDWDAGMTFSLIVDEKAEISPSLVSINGLSNGIAADIFGFGVSGTHSGSSKQTATMTFRMSLRKLEAFVCKRPEIGVRLEGKLGIGVWLQRAVAALQKDDIVNRADTIGYSAEFIVITSGKASVDFTIMPFRPPGSTILGVGGIASRTDTHTLEIAFAPIPKVAAAQTIVVQIPALDVDPTSPKDKETKQSRPVTIQVPVQRSTGPDAIDRQLQQLQLRNDLRR